MNTSTHQVVDVLRSCRAAFHKLYETSSYELTEAEEDCMLKFEALLKVGLLDDYRLFDKAKISLFEIAFLIGYIDKQKEIEALKLSAAKIQT